MKLSVKQNERMMREAHDQVCDYNKRLLKDVMSSKKILAQRKTEPVEMMLISEFFERVDCRLGKIILEATFEEMLRKKMKHAYGEINRGKVFGVVEEDQPLPTMYLYIPWLCEALAQEAERYIREKNYRFIKRLMQEQLIDEPAGLKTFVEKVLPMAIPEKIAFDSAMQRGIKLSQKEGSKLYGQIEKGLFAVMYTWKGEQFFTIFMPGIEYRARLANTLSRHMEVALKSAKAIADALPHDEYYIVKPANSYRDPILFSNRVVVAARESGKKEEWPVVGNSLVNLIDTTEKVSYFSSNGKMYINIDDEMPAAFLIERTLYIYQPPAKDG